MGCCLLQVMTLVCMQSLDLNCPENLQRAGEHLVRFGIVGESLGFVHYVVLSWRSSMK